MSACRGLENGAVQLAELVLHGLVTHDHPAAAAQVAARRRLLGEVVATAGLVLTIALLRGHGERAPLLVPAWILGAYFFTSSTSFANPAVTVARAFSDTFAGIAPASVPAFVAAQLVGVGAGLGLLRTVQTRTVQIPTPESESV